MARVPVLGLVGSVLMALAAVLMVGLDGPGRATPILLLAVGLLALLVALLLRWPRLAAYLAGLWLLEAAFVAWMTGRVVALAGLWPWTLTAAFVGGACFLASAVWRASEAGVNATGPAARTGPQSGSSLFGPATNRRRQ